MSKPWDKLRVPVVEKKPPIGRGKWTANYGATICVEHFSSYPYATIRLTGNGVGRADFTPAALRELAEFCDELADQLEAQ
jgi:hypothetical protein